MKMDLLNNHVQQSTQTTETTLTKFFTIALFNMFSSSSRLETKMAMLPESETGTTETNTHLSLREKLAAQAANFYQQNTKKKLTEEAAKRRGSNSTDLVSFSDDTVCSEFESLEGEDEAHSGQQSPSSYEGYTLGDHEEYLQIRTEKNGFRYCDVSNYFVQSSIPRLVKDYISPLSQDQLKQLYSGIVPSMNDSLDKEPLPVRTLCFRIRPDVEIGEVMDVVQRVFEGKRNNIKSSVLKRQGGHFQCAVAHASAPFFLDAQLCTTKSDNMERQLVLRIHHVQDHAEAFVEVENMRTERKATDEESPSFTINRVLKEASSLLQLISSTQKDNAFVDVDGCSLFLQQNYQKGKSVKAGGTTEHVFPALSSEDFSILQSSLPHCLLIWKGLLHSTCAFHTLVDIPLGECFNTMYLSQIRQLSRETMLEELRMVKTEIDENAEHVEDEYSNFTEMLESTFKRYTTIDLSETILPRVSLTEFPSSKCPPGFCIAAATISNSVAVDPANPASAADQTVRQIYAAFSNLDDKEQRGYLKNLNMEMMARCAQIQGHYEELLGQIEDPKLPSVVAATESFYNFTRQAANHKGRVERFLTWRSKVPLLDFKTSSGQCFITATRILVIKEGAFCNTFLFDLRAVEFEVPSPGCVQITRNGNGEVLHKFRSSMDANKVKRFLYTLKSLEASRRSQLFSTSSINSL
jgi:hypothetical protein